MKRCKVGDRIELGEAVDGTPVAICHAKDGSTFVAPYSKVREGRPIPPSARQLVHARGHDGEVVAVADLDHEGPARTSTPAYREGYDRVFGKRVPKHELN